MGVRGGEFEVFDGLEVGFLSGVENNIKMLVEDGFGVLGEGAVAEMK